jgi:hypothetical protein
MLTLDQLVALHALGFSVEYPGCRASAPSAASISRINHTLGIVLPHIFIEFAERCPAYSGSHFVSIGEDFENPRHILNLNEEFHVTEPPCVPPWLIVVTHVYDGDCDGFDSRHHDDSGEYPFMHWDASSGLDYISGRPFISCHNYLEQTIVTYARFKNKVATDKIIHTQEGISS